MVIKQIQWDILNILFQLMLGLIIDMTSCTVLNLFLYFFFYFNLISHKMHTELFRNSVVNFKKLDLSLNQTAKNNSCSFTCSSNISSKV